MKLLLNGEISFADNSFILKNCDTFTWTFLEIHLNCCDYNYEHIKDIKPDETRKIAYSSLILSDCLRHTKMPYEYKLGALELPFQFNISAKEGNNSIALSEKNKIYYMGG